MNSPDEKNFGPIEGRRLGERRQAQQPYEGPDRRKRERRSGEDRRREERRSFVDRRGPMDHG